MLACDDPYKMLANNFVVSSTDLEISRGLHQSKAIRRWIYREVCNADFYGDFLDCIMTVLVKSGKRKTVNKTLKETAIFFYREFDVPRFRKEVRHYCRRYGRDVQ